MCTRTAWQSTLSGKEFQRTEVKRQEFQRVLVFDSPNAFSGLRYSRMIPQECFVLLVISCYVMDSLMMLDEQYFLRLVG